MGYRKVSGGSFFKWDEPGKELEGKWMGSVEGKFDNQNGIVVVGNETVKFSLTAILADALTPLVKGTQIKIVYLGEMTSEKGTKYKSFDVFVDDDDAGAATQPEDDEVPF